MLRSGAPQRRMNQPEPEVLNSSRQSVFAYSRMVFPVLGGISGSNRAISIVGLQPESKQFIVAIQ